jgi:hypothetical protein
VLRLSVDQRIPGGQELTWALYRYLSSARINNVVKRSTGSRHYSNKWEMSPGEAIAPQFRTQLSKNSAGILLRVPEPTGEAAPVFADAFS